MDMSSLSPTEEAFNQLVVTCSSAYGKIHETLNDATPESINQYRARDVFILRATQKQIGQMTDPAAATALSALATHMNTYEGTMAAFNMIAARFPGDSVAASCRAEVEDRYRAPWVARFGDRPISPDEYAAGSAPPRLLPLPRAGG